MREFYILSVDPGVVTAGACLWTGSAWEHNRQLGQSWRTSALKLRSPLEAIAIGKKGSGGKMYVSQVATLIARLEQRFFTKAISQVWCEEPAIFAATAKGTAAATDVLHMMFFLGSLAQLTRSQGGYFHLAPVMQWKGNLPKSVVNERIRARLEDQEVLSLDDSHDWDACGIGLWAQGVF